ncbi:MAG TPA: UDP-N-acetylmuramoyl-L-alanine--D-glutamate ligase [Jiangellaceae bacterium]|nr:UDP-N-acetylmuramoyl-L-alanine--D-glutamate ligase [Jiangellaceae bacterium]
MTGPAGPTGWLATANRASPWPSLDAVVAGIGVSGFAAADALLQLGARVTVVDERDCDAERERAQILDILGADVRLGPGTTAGLPGTPGLVVTSPGWRPSAPLLVAAQRAGVPVWGEVELAWRLREPDRPAPWLALTGTNGKTTAVRMLGEMLRASGLRAATAGNVGAPVVSAVLDPEPNDVIALELSSFQLHWTSSMTARSAAVLNVAPDHLDWHGSFDAYVAAKGRIYAGVETACVYNVADPLTERLVREADVVEGARAIGFTLGVPAVGMVGVVEDVLVDRAFVAERQRAAAELASVSDVRPAAPHNVANALAAAALARSIGVPPVAVRDGLRAFEPEPHRMATVASIRGVDYVDDSKATNPHAAAASLQAYDRVVWIAGGLAKGARFDELARGAAERLRAVVLLGADRAVIADALSRHAPEIPVVEVSATDNEAMDQVVAAAAEFAQPGDTVLLAPACASMDMFANYGARGEAFAAAVRRRRGQPD